MPTLKLLAGLRRFGGSLQTVDGTVVGDILRAIAVPNQLLFPDDQVLNQDIEVLVNGRNIHFLDGLATVVAPEDRITIFLHGARGHPGG
jgi:molybdopterin converting factor small subunit